MNTAYSFDGSKSYVLATGIEGSDRLVLQDKLLREKSHHHLIEAGLSAGKVVFDIGCGNGMMTTFIAKSVGDSGHVYAVDVSNAQLEAAQHRIKSENLNNVTFIHGDITEQDLPEGIADIVYSRFLLMHLQHPEKAIQKMIKILKPGGVIASQESILSTYFSTYHREVFDNYTKATINLGKFYHVDYDIGKRLKNLYEEAGFRQVDVYYHQMNISPQDAQKLFLLGISEKRKKLLEAKIVSEETITNWEASAKSIPLNDNSQTYGMSNQAYVLARSI